MRVSDWFHRNATLDADPALLPPATGQCGAGIENAQSGNASDCGEQHVPAR
jgi:hypothetical protein